MIRLSTEKVVAPPFRTLAEAQCEHVQLVAQAEGIEVQFLNALPGDNREAAVELARVRRQIRAFEWRLAATGTRMPDGNQRSFAQSLLDFWALRQADLRALASKFRPKTWKGSRPITATPAAGRLLLPYDQATAAEAAAQAEAIYQALPDEAARESAKAAFVTLALDGSGGDELSATLAPFIEGGVVSQQAAAPSGPTFTLAHEALPTAWERFSDWLGEARQKQADLERVLTEAEVWAKTGSAAELPRGSAIDRAAQYSEEDQSISTYVRAAQKKRTIERLLALIIGVAIFFAGGLVVKAIISATASPPPPQAVAPADPAAAAAQAAQEEQEEQLDLSLDENAQANAGEILPPEERGSIGVTGWIWLGYDRNPQVIVENDAKLSVGGITEGTLLRPRVNLKVRDAPSDSEGTAGKRQAGVSSGSLLVALSNSKPAKVKGATQYWLEVRLVPQAYVQLDVTSRVDAEAVRRALSARGFAVPDAQKLPNIARGGGPAYDVRYYYDQDREAAESARAIAGETLNLGEGTLTSLVGTPLAERVKTGTIEVWLFRP